MRKTLIILQVAALALIAVYGAQSSTNAQQHCPVTAATADRGCGN